MEEGRIVVKCLGQYQVYFEEKNYICSLKGNLKKSKIKPLVGDKVLFSKENLQIETILPRQNELIRPSMANLDYGIIVTSLKDPDFSQELLNKFITFLKFYNVEPMIIFTKSDLCQNEIPYEMIEHYKSKGFLVYINNKHDEIPLNFLTSIEDKVVAFLGQTGVGKSTLINKIVPSLNQKIGEYSTVLKRGKHQTTNTILVPFNSSFIADTPGFSSVELSCFKEDFAKYYLNYDNYNADCFFKDCLHLNEKGCVIKEKIKTPYDKLDYEIYLKLQEKLSYRKDRYQK